MYAYEYTYVERECKISSTMGNRPVPWKGCLLVLSGYSGSQDLPILRVPASVTPHIHGMDSTPHQGIPHVSPSVMMNKTLTDPLMPCRPKAPTNGLAVSDCDGVRKGALSRERALTESGDDEFSIECVSNFDHV